MAPADGGLMVMFLEGGILATDLDALAEDKLFDDLNAKPMVQNFFFFGF